MGKAYDWAMFKGDFATAKALAAQINNLVTVMLQQQNAIAKEELRIKQAQNAIANTP